MEKFFEGELPEMTRAEKVRQRGKCSGRPGPYKRSAELTLRASPCRWDLLRGHEVALKVFSLEDV